MPVALSNKELAKNPENQRKKPAGKGKEKPE